MGTLTFQAALGGSVNLLGPNTASNINFTLPSADGTSGQPLQTNGSGTLSFANLAIANGGTGATSFAANQIHYGSFSQSANLTFDGTNLTMGAGSGTASLKVNGGNSGTAGGSNISFGGAGSYAIAVGYSSSILGGAYDAAMLLYSGGGSLVLGSAADIIFSNNGRSSEYMRVTSSGNVGIGTNSPNTKLTIGTPNTQTVALAASFSGVTPIIANGVGMITLNSTDAAAVDKGGVLSFTGNTTTLAGYPLATISGKYETSGAGVYSGYLQFVTSNSSGTLAERMRITSSGNVGIGTSSPSNKLDVVSSASGTLNSRIYNSVTTGNSGAQLQLQTDAGNFYIFKQNSTNVNNSGAGGIGIYGDGAYPMAFYTNSSERMRIDSSGNLLVNRTSQFSNGQYSADFGGTSLRGATYNNTDGNGGANFVSFGTTGTVIGTISQVSTTGVLYNTTSDQRLKENIEDAESASALIDSLQVRQFDWKSDNSHQRYGFVAQELVMVAPEAVHAPADSEEMMAVDYSKLVPMLVKEIQSLRKRLADAGIA